MSLAATSPRFDALDRLAQRVLGGEVVFFIGSGFSLDSEGNGVDRLAGRLLARLLALTTTLAEALPDEHTRARSLLSGLKGIFGLTEVPTRDAKRFEPVRCMTRENVRALARDYFSFNEWCVSAFGGRTHDWAEAVVSKRIGDAAEARVRGLEGVLLNMLDDATPLEPIDWKALSTFARASDRGKALFLDTMGFADPRIMGGEPSARDSSAVHASYAERLRPRHHALARLAREGLLSVVVTTNYDLLLEGAYRLAGFRERGSGCDGDVPATAVPEFARIAAADHYFSSGSGHRTALILKIHGCVEAYRKARACVVGSGAALDPATAVDHAWAAYLPSLVFTYREIQTWRNDAWSRDLVRTLLRTHTLAFCGYSSADPVMHATFREVYEEMAGARGKSRRKTCRAEDAPAFNFNVAGKREFHSFEILRAASEAGGHDDARLVEHPNHIEFEVKGGFPSLDDEFTWLTHLVVRAQQRRALESRLRRLTPRLLGNVCRDADFVELSNRFAALCTRESGRVGVLGNSVSARRAFDSVTGWTWSFVPAFLRELALAELIESAGGAGRALFGARAWAWYHPVSERLDWSAWAAVLELALRSLIATWRGERSDDVGTEWFGAEDGAQAVVSFAHSNARRQPHAVAIRLAGFERPSKRAALDGAFRSVHTWELELKDVPWCRVMRGTAPSAREIWAWALGTMSDRERAAQLLGVES